MDTEQALHQVCSAGTVSRTEAPRTGESVLLALPYTCLSDLSLDQIHQSHVGITQGCGSNALYRIHLLASFQRQNRAGEKAQWLRVFVTIPDDLRSIPITHIRQLPSASSGTHTH